ncbi:MAG: diguanylate cyclase [Deltaproteobacteria bacterium]|nr:diguanylate cyclase [Deltaproteobacteria bacterium]
MTDTDKVLLVDDSSEARAAMKSALRETFTHFIEADDGLSAIKAFVEEKPCFIITDIEMPSISGYKFITTIRAMEDGRNVPIIMLSGTKQSLKNKLSGFNAGASDFLMKPYEDDELIARVRALLRVHRLMEELKEKNLLLEKLAVTDELTGLYNRRYFFESVKSHMALGLRYHFKIACLLMDIDHFKKINDTCGHMAGDDILRKMGRLLNSCKREGELLARFGGEEFIICLFNTDSESALLAAERFRHLIKSYDFSSALYPSRRITVSVGVSIYPQSRPITIDDLIKTADKAMYQSKADGRDRVTISEEAEPKPAA